MSKKIFGLALSALLFALCVVAEAQQPKKISQIGVLLPWAPTSGVSVSFLQAFRQGLHEHAVFYICINE